MCSLLSTLVDIIFKAICTLEKANSLLNRLMKEKSLDKLGVLVVDELHMVGSGGGDSLTRGYILEILLLKAKYWLKHEIQLIGMSATMPKIEELGK